MTLSEHVPAIAEIQWAVDDGARTNREIARRCGTSERKVRAVIIANYDPLKYFRTRQDEACG